MFAVGGNVAMFIKKFSRLNLTPTLNKFKFMFDVVKSLTDAYMFMVDLKTSTALISPNFAADFNLPGEVINNISEYWFPLIHKEEQPDYIIGFENTMLNHDPPEFITENRIRNRKGNFVWIRTRARLGYDREGNAIIFVGVMTKMAAKNDADELTGLLNKYQFELEVNKALNNCRNQNIGGAIFLFGLDNFKLINETHNRAVGNVILRHVANIVSKLLPHHLKLFKLDGDTFAVVYPNANEESIEELFSNIQRALLIPIVVNGRSFFCTISSGTVFYPQSGREYLVLHKHAEAAMDLAKREGKNQNIIFTKEQYNRWVRSLYMREYLRRSVENYCADFELYYQPQVATNSRRIVGAEALLRWHNPRGKMVSPTEFVPILEETKLILPVGRWVLEEAIKTVRRWRNIISNFKISVNLSYEQLKDFSFQEFVVDCLNRYGVPTDALILELTESKVVADWSFVNQQFDEFRRNGIKIAIDDFGTGNSSLAAMKYLSCDIVKIDRAFVENILESEFDCRLVHYTIMLCHSIGIKTCIEGVEEIAEYELLKNQCHADAIQGYLFGRPEPIEVFENKFLSPYIEERLIVADNSPLQYDEMSVTSEC